MRYLSSSAGHPDSCQTSGEIGYFTANSQELYDKSLINKANAVPIINIFRHYNVRVNEQMRKTICPFLSHKGGKENSPSFWYYPETNTYCCFGCRIGSRGVDFVCEMEKCDREVAANKIISLFGSQIDNSSLLNETNNASERLEIMMQFSKRIFEFYQNNHSEHAFKFIEHICWTYDQINLLHNPNNEALLNLIEELLSIIENYNSNLKLSF